MENLTTKNQGRQPRGFADSPLFHFFLKHFCRFAKKWPNKKDIARIGIIFDEADKVPGVGYPVLWELLTIAINPRSIKALEPRPMFLSCLKGSPDFTLQLICHVRREFAKFSAEKKAILIQINNGKFSDTEKTTRSETRALIDQHNQAKPAAYNKALKKCQDMLSKKKG